MGCGTLLVIVGLIFTIIRGILKGYISEPVGAIFLIFSIFLISIPLKTIKRLFKLLVFAIPIYLFAKEYNMGFRSIFIIMINLAPLIIMMYGLYLMFHHGLFGGGK